MLCTSFSRFFYSNAFPCTHIPRIVKGFTDKVDKTIAHSQDNVDSSLSTEILDVHGVLRRWFSISRTIHGVREDSETIRRLSLLYEVLYRVTWSVLVTFILRDTWTGALFVSGLHSRAWMDPMVLMVQRFVQQYYSSETLVRNVAEKCWLRLNKREWIQEVLVHLKGDVHESVWTSRSNTRSYWLLLVLQLVYFQVCGLF